MNIFDYLDILPPDLRHFLLTTILSFVVGLEFHNYRRNNKNDLGYGTSRTLTLIGVIGFVAYIVDNSHQLYLGGLFALIVFMAIYYFIRLRAEQLSLLSPLTALFTYFITPVVMVMPDWFSVLYVAVILLILGAKPKIREFSDAIRQGEMVTFTKFMVMVAVVLPLLPDQKIAANIPVSYYQAWIALLVVSGVSYASYLMQTYWFKNHGLLLTGVLGGIYSSTVTTVVLARRSQGRDTGQIAQAIILATVMMYVRLLAIVFILGHRDAAYQLLLPFLLLSLIALGGIALVRFRYRANTDNNSNSVAATHPLEFKTALVFTLLFVVFAVLTAYVLREYGNQGLHVLSFLVGLTDIDPFILSLLGGHYQLPPEAIVNAIIIASGGNNLMKGIYAASLGRNHWCYFTAAVLLVLTLVSLAMAFWL